MADTVDVIIHTHKATGNSLIPGWISGCQSLFDKILVFGGFGDGATDCKCHDLGKLEFIKYAGSWARTINAALQACKSEFVLLVDEQAWLAPDCAKQLLTYFMNTENCGGVNPVFLASDRINIFRLGIGVDSEGMLHALYKGLPNSSSLASKSRTFQLADPGVFLTSRKIFESCSGINVERNILGFFDFCLKVGNRNLVFATVPEAVAVFENAFLEFTEFGLWNSLVIKNKIPPDAVRPDYADIIKNDGLEYGITDWLWEGPVNFEFYDPKNPYLAYVNDPNPFTLMGWWNYLDQADVALFLAASRNLPVSLPLQFRYYQAKAERQARFSLAASLMHMAGQIQAWQAKSRLFHYGKLKKGMRLLADAGIYNISLDECADVYDASLELNPAPEFRAMDVVSALPKIAVAMPVYNPQPDFLIQAIESVKAQTYQNWELCIADDASTESAARDVLNQLDDKRIRVVYRERNGNIALASNTALDLVSAPWVGMLDQDDTLAPEALAYAARTIAAFADLKFIYSDEDRIDEWNVRRYPIYRTDFSVNFPGGVHLSIYSHEAIRKVGMFDPAFTGSQDYDLNLRLYDKFGAVSIRHIPHILYHWRVHGGSTAGSIQSKPYILQATQKALEAHARRMGWQGKAVMSHVNNFFCFHHAGKISGNCALILLNRGVEPSPKLLEAIRDLGVKVSLDCYQLPLMADNSSWQNNLDDFKTLKNTGTSCSYGEIADEIKADMHIFVDSALEPLDESDLAQLLYAAQQKGVAAACSIIWDEGKIWHGGLAPDITGLPFRLLFNKDASEIKRACWGEFNLVRESLGASPFLLSIQNLKDSFLKHIPVMANDLQMAKYGLAEQKRGRAILVTPLAQVKWIDRVPDIGHGKDELAEFFEEYGDLIRDNKLRNPVLYKAPDFDWSIILNGKL